jgi:hypothetical protein
VYWIAAGAVVLLLVVVEGLARWGDGSFLPTVILGKDGRTSTSKTFVFLWTLLVGWALVSLLIAGELTHQRACTGGATESAVKLCTKQHNDIALLQLGWLHFIHVGLLGSYLVLLGIPAAAAVAAKGITQTKLANASIVKPTYIGSTGADGIGPRLAQIFSADDETTDIGDFQYVIFNLITAVYFVVKFVKPSGAGLPTIPDTLLGLTGVSASLYVAKKAVARAEPKVTAVFPTTLRQGQAFTVVGTNLADPQDAGADATAIAINGVFAGNVVVDPEVADRVTAVVPVGLVPAGATAGTGVDGTLQVSTAYGSITPGFAVRCLA